MDYYDEELLEEKRELKRKKHTTIETGMYAGENLITFEWKVLPDTNVRMPLPESFVVLPDEIKRLKFPSNRAPKFIVSSLDSTVNICFRKLLLSVQRGELKKISDQCQTALKNTNPSIRIINQTDMTNAQGLEMSSFEYRGYQIDGQSFNRVYLIALQKNVLYSSFICRIQDKNNWVKIIDAVFMALEENVE